MIPLRLRLRNFMCYRENVPPLVLEGIHVACLCGENGHGKSALLDAMTWALWGESRAKSDDELIHLGQMEMEVELEFLLGSERYRVMRRRSKARIGHPSGQTVLELQIAGGDGFRSISGNTVRDTQRRIVELLRMDYQTFINSAFLLQGRADEFTVKAPGERKQVLADILGLSLYDKWETQARELSRDRELERQRLEGLIATMDAELGQKAGYEQERRQVLLDLTQVARAMAEAEGKRQRLREEKEALTLKQQELQEVERRIASAHEELRHLEGEGRDIQQRMLQHETLLIEREQIESGYQQLVASRTENELWNTKLQQHTALREGQVQLERAILQARGKLEGEVRHLQGEVARLAPLVASLASLEGELERVRVQGKALTGLEAELGEKREQQRALTEEQGVLRATNERLKAEMEELRDKVALLAQGGERCPLCGSAIGEQERQRIAGQYRQEGESKRDAFRDNEAKMRRLFQEAQRLRNEVEDLERRLQRERAAVQTRSAGLELELVRAREAAQALETVQGRLGETQGRLESGDYATMEQRELKHLARQIAELAYDAQKHQAVQQRLAELVPLEQKRQALEKAELLLTQEKEALARLEANMERWREQLKDFREQREVLVQVLPTLPRVENQLAEVEQELAGLSQRERELRQVQGAVQQRLEPCHEFEQERQVKGRELRRVAEEKSIYDELTLAFGKRGVQALIIESALPEMEAEGNRLLGLMTDGRMSVKLETQRSTRRGDLVETLDIKISDELGTRNYELYSGGEAFRVNFALRVALSKLLARRAGVRLQTLVMDEGFGTQDAAGREKLIEAINSVQDDFERILVITHLEELKDAFPVRIEVTKTEVGSTISVV